MSMRRKESPQYVIDSYQKRQQVMPFVIGALAVLLVVIGIAILIIWFTGGDNPKIVLFPTDTPTPTLTASSTPVTPTLSPSPTFTETLTPTITITPTRSGPFEYTIQEGDNCWEIAQRFEVDFDVLLAINNFGNGCPIAAGDKILVPATNQQLPTDTPVPVDEVRGAQIEYKVKTGDSLEFIASLFDSTVEDIMTRNEITNANDIKVGDLLKIKVGLVTKTPTLAATSTTAP